MAVTISSTNFTGSISDILGTGASVMQTTDLGNDITKLSQDEIASLSHSNPDLVGITRILVKLFRVGESCTKKILTRIPALWLNGITDNRVLSNDPFTTILNQEKTLKDFHDNPGESFKQCVKDSIEENEIKEFYEYSDLMNDLDTARAELISFSQSLNKMYKTQIAKVKCLDTLDKEPNNSKKLIQTLDLIEKDSPIASCNSARSSTPITCSRELCDEFNAYEAYTKNTFTASSSMLSSFTNLRNSLKVKLKSKIQEIQRSTGRSM